VRALLDAGAPPSRAMPQAPYQGDKHLAAAATVTINTAATPDWIYRNFSASLVVLMGMVFLKSEWACRNLEEEKHRKGNFLLFVCILETLVSFSV